MHVTDHTKTIENLSKYANVVFHRNFHDYFLILELIVEASLVLACHKHSRILTLALIRTHSLSLSRDFARPLLSPSSLLRTPFKYYE